MYCEALAREACPCILADIEHCRCCSLLSGQPICQCDYPGVCIFEKHRWEEKQPQLSHDHIAAVFPSAAACGVIIQWSGCESAVPGLVVTLTQTNRPSIRGVILRTYPEQKMAYLLVTDRFMLEELAPICIQPQYNVFGADSAHIAEPAGKSVIILTDGDLMPFVTVFAGGLSQRGAVVQTAPLTEKLPAKTADLFIFISRNKQDLTRALKRLPLYCSRSAFWLVE